MIGLYLASFLFGAVLVGTALLGFGDKDVDHGGGGGGHDGADGAHHGKDVFNVSPWLPFLSLRFWSFGSVTFGLAGLLLSLVPIPALVVFAVAALVGVIVGSTSALLFRRVRTDEVSGATTFARYIGEEARVVVAIREGASGRIAVETHGGRVEIPARSRDRELVHGERVIIAAVAQGVADVSPIEPRRSIPAAVSE